MAYVIAFSRSHARVRPPPHRAIVSSGLHQQLQNALGDAYVLERELGGGGMSRVFLALERALGRKVVVKVILPELAAGVSVERFRREIQLAAQLQHPHIVPLLSAGEAEGLPYFIMPFVTGESLRARVAREGELPISETVRILRDVVSALAYAHGRGVVHRDIKPDNVLLSGGVAVVTDFGVAKAVSASADTPGASGITSMGIALGTPAYMAPEQATANPQTDHRADLYALGAMAYEMLTGSPPFSGRSPQAILAAHVVEEPVPVERRRPSVPPLLATLVKECLAKRPADRPQAATEVMHLLDAIVTPSGGTAPTTAVSVPAVRMAVTRPHRWPLAVSLAALAVLGAGGVLWVRRTSRPAAAPSASLPEPARTTAAPADSSVPSTPEAPPAPVQEPRAPAPTPAGGEALKAKADRSAPARRPVPSRQVAPPTQESVVAPRRAESPAPADSVPAPSHGVAAAPPAAPPSPVPADTAPPAVPAPRVSPPAAVPAPATPPADPRPEIGSVVAEYANAIEAENLERLRKVYPGMTSAQQLGWEQFFQLVRDVKARLSLTQLDVSNGTADAQVTGTYTYLNTSTGHTEQQPVSFRAALRREGGQWRMSQVR
jgi:protein kinase-like protein